MCLPFASRAEGAAAAEDRQKRIFGPGLHNRMWLDVAWLWLDVRLSWLRSRAKKLFANMQNVNSFPSRLLWSFWPCGMNWIFISHVPCGSYVGFYRAEAGVEQERLEQKQEQQQQQKQTHKCQLNKMFRFKTGKKRCRRWHISVSADSFAISLSLSLFLPLGSSAICHLICGLSAH